MQKEKSSIQKADLRILFSIRRQNLSQERREEAKQKVLQIGKEKKWANKNILSFFSFGAEIDLFLLNELLAQEGRLFLPRTEEETLIPYRVFSLSTLIPSPSFSYKIYEPNPALSSRALPQEIDLVLTPALAFDRKGYRLGFGKGWYDRFFAHHKLFSIGVGFKEQLSEESLPTDSWDVPVDELFLI